jgi:hypothetical protein
MSKQPVAQFTCQKYPFLRVRDLVFNGGILLVYSEGDAEVVRGIDDFGIHVHEVPLNAKPKIEVKAPGQARQGTQSTLVQQEPEIKPEEPVVDEIVYVPEKAPEVTVLKNGWYEYDGKKFRKSQLPDEVKNLV